jgi:hypothetical protein
MLGERSREDVDCSLCDLAFVPLDLDQSSHDLTVPSQAIISQIPTKYSRTQLDPTSGRLEAWIVSELMILYKLERVPGGVVETCPYC